MQEITAKSWAELNDLLFGGTWQEPLHRFRATFVYRGQENACDPLTTSLMRMAGEKAGDVEAHMLRAFRRYSHPYQSEPSGSFWNTLALAQHHGLPTRLLDWTYSPFVALHFATVALSLHDKEGAIWCVNFLEVKKRLPEKIRDILDDEGSTVLSVELLNDIAASFAEYDVLAEPIFVAFFEPPSIDERIVNQFALFSLLSAPDVSLQD